MDIVLIQAKRAVIQGKVREFTVGAVGLTSEDDALRKPRFCADYSVVIDPVVQPVDHSKVLPSGCSIP